MKKLICLQAVMFFLLVSVTNGETGKSRFGIGFQFLSPYFNGFNATYNLNNIFSVQGIIATSDPGFSFSVKERTNPAAFTMSCVKLTKRVAEKERYATLLYVMGGRWNYEGFDDRAIYGSESQVGFGFGFVVECRPKKPSSDLPIFFDFELGLTFVRFDNFKIDLSGPSMGGRIYYQF